MLENHVEAWQVPRERLEFKGVLWTASYGSTGVRRWSSKSALTGDFVGSRNSDPSSTGLLWFAAPGCREPNRARLFPCIVGTPRQKYHLRLHSSGAPTAVNAAKVLFTCSRVRSERSSDAAKYLNVVSKELCLNQRCIVRADTVRGPFFISFRKDMKLRMSLRSMSSR